MARHCSAAHSSPQSHSLPFPEPPPLDKRIIWHETLLLTLAIALTLTLNLFLTLALPLPPTQVPWHEILTLINWALDNVRVVDVHTGGTQCFYVNLSHHVYSALRVPHLGLQSPRCGGGGNRGRGGPAPTAAVEAPSSWAKQQPAHCWAAQSCRAHGPPPRGVGFPMRPCPLRPLSLPIILAGDHC